MAPKKMPTKATTMFAGKTGGETKGKSGLLAGRVDTGSGTNGKKGGKVLKRDGTTDVEKKQKLLQECEDHGIKTKAQTLRGLIEAVTRHRVSAGGEHSVDACPNRVGTKAAAPRRRRTEVEKKQDRGGEGQQEPAVGATGGSGCSEGQTVASGSQTAVQSAEVPAVAASPRRSPRKRAAQPEGVTIKRDLPTTPRGTRYAPYGRQFKPTVRPAAAAASSRAPSSSAGSTSSLLRQMFGKRLESSAALASVAEEESYRTVSSVADSPASTSSQPVEWSSPLNADAGIDVALRPTTRVRFGPNHHRSIAHRLDAPHIATPPPATDSQQDPDESWDPDVEYEGRFDPSSQLFVPPANFHPVAGPATSIPLFDIPESPQTEGDITGSTDPLADMVATAASPVGTAPPPSPSPLRSAIIPQVTIPEEEHRGLIERVRELEEKLAAAEEEVRLLGKGKSVLKRKQRDEDCDEEDAEDYRRPSPPAPTWSGSSPSPRPPTARPASPRPRSTQRNRASPSTSVAETSTSVGESSIIAAASNTSYYSSSAEASRSRPVVRPQPELDSPSKDLSWLYKGKNQDPVVLRRLPGSA